MKVLVPVKRVVDYNVKVRVKSDGTGVELAARPEEPVSEAAIQYMNRLSDFLFVASRAMNDNGAGDVLWVPGQNR